MRFIVFGDSKGKENGINKKVLKAILNETCKLNPKPEFIVMSGDTVAGSNKEEILASQLKALRNLIYKYHPKMTLIPVIGNHEVNIDPIDDKFEKIFSQNYSDLFPNNSLEGYNNTVYYRDFGNTRIIVLNAFHYGSTHKIDKDQLNWFEKVASDYKKNKLVFIHSPAFPTGAHLGHCLDLYPEDRDIFWEIVDKCGIDIVFSGHEHNYSRRLIGKIYQVIAGGGGEKLRNKYNSKKGVVVAPIDVYHFLVVDVEINCIKVTAISSKGKILDEFKIDKTSLSG
ncbi:metallophosphoesterase family protein [Clostridium vincentii]|uniref:3',5'-cyclic adenosine monophosphate phosphodiesterase CpdA n=1 Tax=Clostridium vincentii TaxID=52704 RepID=A0A2T0BIT5_9CLOT|nr:metallophosphoesterase [Clostridium vincentii]PRR83805.1 3',5'-cyclic adenosine monophosphate phosphodiesterase CpdA [Clostridium vincentii]